jgi:hypothetical protein
MVHFFGILSPDFTKRTDAPEAPGKADFFGGLPDFSFGAVPMSRAEQDAYYLVGKGPEPVEDDRALVTRFASMPRPF